MVLMKGFGAELVFLGVVITASDTGSYQGHVDQNSFDIHRNHAKGLIDHIVKRNLCTGFQARHLRNSY